MKIAIFKDSDSQPIELDLKKLLIYDNLHQPIGVAIEINEQHIAVAHSGDNDFLPILLQAGYKGPVPKQIRLKQSPSGLILPE